MCTILIPTNWNGSFKSTDIDKIRADFRFFTKNFNEKKQVVVITGFEAMMRIARTLINTAVADAKFIPKSAFDALENVPQALFVEKIARTEKGILKDQVSFSEEKILLVYDSIVSSHPNCWSIVISHPLATEAILLDYAKKNELNEGCLPNYIALQGDTIFLHDKKIIDKKRYGVRTTPYKQFRGDRID